MQLITYGFPIDFNRDPLHWEDKNHNLALQFPEHVIAYLQEEIKHGAIMGPSESVSIESRHFSPFMTREKNNSDKRVIMDLSWPRDASVRQNSYLATHFVLTFSTVDNIMDGLNRLGTGTHLYKVDVSHALRHMKLDSFDYDLFGLKWYGVVFHDTCLPFGSRHGMQIFQHLSDAMHFIMQCDRFDVINYMDHFVGIVLPSVACHSFEHLLEVLACLGLDISDKKLVTPSTKVTCLIIEIDSVAKTISIP